MLFGILWRASYDKTLHRVAGKSMPGIKLIIERGVSEKPLSHTKLLENKYLLDEAARSVFKGLLLIADFYADVDLLSSVMSEQITQGYFSKTASPSSSPIRAISRGGRGLPLAVHNEQLANAYRNGSPLRQRSKSPSQSPSRSPSKHTFQSPQPYQEATTGPFS